jgi:hypothetical protein
MLLLLLCYFSFVKLINLIYNCVIFRSNFKGHWLLLNGEKFAKNVACCKNCHSLAVVVLQV